MIFDMYPSYIAFGTGVIGIIAGFVAGILIMRNNYKHFSRDEETIKKFILDKRLNAEQTVLKIRNILNV